MPSLKRCIFAAIYFMQPIFFFGASAAGTDSTSLDVALSLQNIPNGEIIFDGITSVILQQQVRAVQSSGTFNIVPNANITIDGNGNSLIGTVSDRARGFFVGANGAEKNGSVTIRDLHFVNCKAKGGNGGTSGGGGGLGAGGGLFVGANTIVFVTDCTFSGCTAKGGDGAIVDAHHGGGGGGLRGNGGAGHPSTGGFGGGGGGFGGNGENQTGTSGGGGGGSSGFGFGNASGSTPGSNFANSGASGSTGVGGMGAAITDGEDGGYGGGGGGAGGTPFNNGGRGGFSGGGGGAGGAGFSGIGGNGGFGGGGGGGETGGMGMFGAGGGAGGVAGGNGIGGEGGFGGGNGSSGGSGFGGRGAGFGGAIFIQTGGKLTLTTTENFTGPLFDGNSAQAGDIGNASMDPLSNGGALGQDIFMMSEAELILDLSTPLVMPSAIHGNIGSEGEDESIGGLRKQGAGNLTLVGNNTYTGRTVLEQGNLFINGSVISEIEVQEGTTLSGNFSVLKMGSSPISGNVINAGRFIPGTNGDGDGQITIEGNFTNESTGTLVIDITPTGNANDKIFLSGNAQLNGGTLEVYVGEGNYIAGTQYEVILGTVAGAFANQSDPTQIGPGAGTIRLGVTTGSLILTILSDRIFEDQCIDPGVPRAVADCIISATIDPDSDFANIVEILGTLNCVDVNQALTNLSAVRFGALEWINARNNSYIADILSQHLFELCCSPRTCCGCACNNNIWTAVFGNLMDNKKNLDNLQRYDADAVGAIAGIDSCCNSEGYFGAAFGYTHTDLTWRKKRGNGDINSYYGAFYGSWICNWLILDFVALGGASDNDLIRKIDFATIHRKARSDFWNYFFTAHVGARAKWNCRCNFWEPYALGDYHYFHRQSFKEKNAESLNLRVKSKDQHFIRAEGGLRWFYEHDLGYCCYAPYLGVSWVGEFPINKSKHPASFIGQSCVFKPISFDSDVSLIAGQGGVKWTNCTGMSFLIGYKGLFNNKTRIHQMEGRLEWIF